jgi:tetratricopeptide (TPR) repeat protein
MGAPRRWSRRSISFSRLPPPNHLALETLRARAIALHRAGRLAEAERIYTDLLRQDPADVVALTASAAALRELGRPREALARATAAVAVHPSADAYCHQGVALRDLGRLAEALTSFDRAIALQPQAVEAHNYRGMTLQQLGRVSEALATFEAALALRPQSAELHSNRGNMLRRLQRLPEALASYERAIALQPSFAAAHNNRGLVLQSLNRYREAAASYQRALELQPDFAEAHGNLATVQCELGEPAAALSSCRRALELQPGMPGIHGNLANALRDLERPEEALTESELAICADPASAANHCHRGNALHDLGRIPEAIASYDRAIRLDERYALARFNKALCLLLTGDFAQGLPLYEWRKQLGSYAAPAISAPEWLGDEDVSGKTFLVHADQALGDSIQFCRYVKLLEAHGARVVLAVQPQLRELLGNLSATSRIVGIDAPPESCDYHCALMSLPLAFRTTLADVPAKVPYVFPEPLRLERWTQRLGGAGFRVGVAWQGSRNRIDVGRSVPLEMLARLADIPGVRLISLQKGAALEQLRAGPRELPIEIPGEPFDEGSQAFLDSAAVMSVLDLVITCDTALAHLAGALGRPTWIALKHVPDWRWLLDRSDSPWYPSMRVFRQSRRGDWEGVFAAIHAQLARLAQAGPRDARYPERGRTDSG